MTTTAFRGLLIILAFSAAGSSVRSAENPRLIELRVGAERHQGRVLSRDSQNVLLLDRSGKITEVPLNKVSSFRTVSPRFAPLTPTMLNSELLRELGSQFQIKTTRHYVVAASRGRAQQYVELFEEIYRAFHMHFSVRGFELERPEFPMVAIVFPDHSAFADYAKRDKVDARPGLMGYYMPGSNRVALFEGSSDGIRPQGRRYGGRVTPIEEWSRPETWLKKPALRIESLPVSKTSVLPGPSGSIQADLRDTMIHEATHQIAFNVGLHSRTHKDPQWVVEGLATVFEPDGMRDSAKGLAVEHRINRERYVWFQNYARKRRPENSLGEFVKNDELFETATLDAYSQAWALSFFLIETRPRKYATYLKSLAASDGQNQGSLFTTIFGANTQMLEAEMLRFFQRLK